MLLKKKKLLAVFLEKDNLKMVAYEGKNRIFAGQISFSPEVVRDAFIADAGKFSSQVKVAFAQKPALRDVSDVVLFLPPDKTFTKTMADGDSLDAFVQSLPYFKEELIVKSLLLKPKEDGRVTHIAFEKKLVEDLQRPFLESGKIILSVESMVNNLVLAFAQPAQYFLFAPFDKEVTFAVVDNGGVNEASAFKPDIFVTRFGEYVSNHNLSEVKMGYTVGVFPTELAEKIHHAQGLTLSPLVSRDIYDLVVESYQKPGSKFNLDFNFSLPAMPKQKTLFLVGAVVAGIILVTLVVRNIPGGANKKDEIISPVAAPAAVAPTPEPKPADYPVRILNGTLVEGEGKRLADKIKKLGFEITETKNATTAGFVATRLRTVEGVPEKIIATLKSALEETYQSVVVEPLVDEKVKIEIIIGKKK